MAETRISKAEDDSSSFDSKETSIQNKVCDLTLKLDDLETRSWRLNLRLIGLPEKTEEGDAMRFFQAWLPEVLDPDTNPAPLITEQTQTSANFERTSPRCHHEVSQLQDQSVHEGTETMETK